MEKQTPEQKARADLEALGVPKEVATQLIQHVGLEEAVAAAELVILVIARTNDRISPGLNGKPNGTSRMFLRRLMVGISYDFGLPEYPNTWGRLRHQLQPFGVTFPTRLTSTRLTVEQFYTASLCILTSCNDAKITVLMRRLAVR